MPQGFPSESLAGRLTDPRVEQRMLTLSQAVEQTADSVFITDSSGVIEFVNSAFETLTGYTRDEVVGRTPRILKSGRHSSRFYESLWKEILAGRAFHGTFANTRKDGVIYQEEKTISAIRNAEGEITHFVSTGRDVTDRARAEEEQKRLIAIITTQKHYKRELIHAADHDALTGVSNRRTLARDIDHQLALARVHGRGSALLFLDIDDFKAINESFGHEIGDEYLIHVSHTLSDLIGTRATLARLGGDEFAILLPGCSLQQARRLAAGVLRTLRDQAFIAGGRRVRVSASIGIALSPCIRPKAKGGTQSACTTRDGAELVSVKLDLSGRGGLKKRWKSKVLCYSVSRLSTWLMAASCVMNC
jgi:diguanylate cyclase (GGDEF)-like protein/PAS domain S-box-containing protein